MLIFLAVGYTVLAISADLLNHAVHGIIFQVRAQERRCSGFAQDGVEYRYRTRGLIRQGVCMRPGGLLRARLRLAGHVYLLIVYIGCLEIYLADALSSVAVLHSGICNITYIYQTGLLVADLNEFSMLLRLRRRD